VIATISWYGPTMAAKRAPPSQPRGSEVEALRRSVHQFVRRFGLLVARHTPCGSPISISYAHALMVLLTREREQATTSHSDLGGVLSIDKSNVARLCERMVKAGHATQISAPGDGRSRLVALTPAGVRLAERVEQGSRDRLRRVTESIPASRRAMVLAALADLNAAVQTLDQVEES
jgi:DNA-binding MarR family transcriptional regulator